jgi:hypothetical protein
MSSSDKFNQFVHQNSGSVLYLDENLILEKELRQEIIFWGSIYGGEFREMPENAVTSENEYRKWCWKTTGFMPKRRTAGVFDDYIRPRMVSATARAVLPGTDYGAEVDDAIEVVLKIHSRNCKNLDTGGVWEQGDWVWVETLPDSTCGQEAIIRIQGLMRRLGYRESIGQTEGKVK